MLRKILLVWLLGHSFQMVAAQPVNDKQPHSSSALYIQMLKRVTDVMVEDVTSPVAAARYYSYVALSAAEALQSEQGISSKLNNYEPWKPAKKATNNKWQEQVAVLAVLRSGEKLLPSGYKLKPVIDSLQKLWANAEPGAYEWVDSAVAHVIRYAAADGFRKLSGLRRYTPVPGDGFWQPTAPGFMSAVEPQWKTIRPMVLPNILSYRAIPAVAYDTTVGSDFYRLMKEVYDTCRQLNAAQKDIAMFWDCNPFAVQQIGHMEFGLKKISPGGHWIGITGIACLKEQLNLQQTATAHLLVAITLHDAFIACWNEKYSSNRVRPETAIQRLLDVNWRPLLQTPPFPEYTSGHSVISSAVAELLSALFGDNYSFNDDTEVEFGLPVRPFQSFRQAAGEASVSRLYGGIHFRDAIDNGITQGRNIGKAVVAKMNPPKMGLR